MAGKVRALIDEVIRVRTETNPSMAPFVRAHLMMKGIHPDAYDHTSPDDPEKVAMLEAMIQDFRS